jgi:hypothetical protein
MTASHAARTGARLSSSKARSSDGDGSVSIGPFLVNDPRFAGPDCSYVMRKRHLRGVGDGMAVQRPDRAFSSMSLDVGLVRVVR